LPCSASPKQTPMLRKGKENFSNAASGGTEQILRLPAYRYADKLSKMPRTNGGRKIVLTETWGVVRVISRGEQTLLR